MDQHQRDMWHQMVTEVERCESGDLPLGELVADLRGLYVEADPHDPALRSDFEAAWGRIKGQHELRTEPWAPVGSAREENLLAALSGYREWVERVIAADSTDEHG
jgi:hypothetical protein